MALVVALLITAATPLLSVSADDPSDKAPVAANEWMAPLDDSAYLNSVNIPETVILTVQHEYKAEDAKTDCDDNVLEQKEGLDRFYGLQIKRDTGASALAALFSEGNIYVLIGGVVLLAAVIVIFVIREKKLKKKVQTEDPSSDQ